MSHCDPEPDEPEPFSDLVQVQLDYSKFSIIIQDVNANRESDFTPFEDLD